MLAERSYLVSVLHDAFATTPHVVHVPAQGGRVELVVRPGGSSGSFQIRAHLILPLGERGGRNVEVRLEDPTTGALVYLAPWSEETVFELRAPTGRYRLVVRGRPYFDSHHGTLIRPRGLGRTELELDVGPREASEVTLQLDVGARIDLELAGFADDADRAAARERWGEPQDRDEILREERYAAQARVHLARRAGGWERVDRARPGGWHSSSITVGNDWVLGERTVSEMTSPGPWTLVARLPGGREASADVVLRAGETTRVRLEFGP